jgi:hypothetical protein
MKKKEKVARPGGLELPTFWFVGRTLAWNLWVRTFTSIDKHSP